MLSFTGAHIFSPPHTRSLHMGVRMCRHRSKERYGERPSRSTGVMGISTPCRMVYGSAIILRDELQKRAFNTVVSVDLRLKASRIDRSTWQSLGQGGGRMGCSLRGVKLAVSHN